MQTSQKATKVRRRSCCHACEVYAMKAGGLMGQLQTDSARLCTGHVIRTPQWFRVTVTNHRSSQSDGWTPSVVAMLQYICHRRLPDPEGPTAPVVLHRVTKLGACAFAFTLQRQANRMPEILLCVPAATGTTRAERHTQRQATLQPFASYVVDKRRMEGLWHDAVQMFLQGRLRARSQDKCVLCMTNPCEKRLSCGHGAMCSACVRNLTSCPFCRREIANGRLTDDGTCNVFSDAMGDLQLQDSIQFSPYASPGGLRENTRILGTLQTSRGNTFSTHENVIEREVQVFRVSDRVTELLRMQSTTKCANVACLRGCVGVGFSDYRRWANLPAPYTFRLYSDYTNLGSLFETTALTPAEKFGVLVGAWQGIQVLGRHSYFHGDIRSANVLLHRDQHTGRITGKIGDIDGSCLKLWDHFDRWRHYGHPFDRDSVNPGASWVILQRSEDRVRGGPQADQVMLGQGGHARRPPPLGPCGSPR